MRRYVLAMLALALVVAVAACGGKPSTAEFTKADSEAIKQLIQDFTAAYNAKDVARVQTHFTGTGSVLPANRGMLRGTDGVKAYYEERLKIDGATDLAIDPIAIEGEGPLAFVVGKFTLNLPPVNGEPRHDRGKVIWIVKRLAGRWLFEWQIMSSDLPPAPPAPAAAPAK